MLRRELRYFFTALMFFTRIPCPPWVDHSAEALNRSRKYFPAVGWIVGGLSAGVFALAAVVWPAPLAVLLATAAGVWLTGAFHEDGFADVCDGFGGGWTADQILRIMKDSRVGAFGAIGIGLLMLLKGFALIEIARLGLSWTILALVNAHTTSRFVAATFVQTHRYVADPDQSKSKPIANARLSRGETAYSLLLALLPFGLYGAPLWLALFPLAFAPKWYLGRMFGRRIGGYTGDCLGATQQVVEVWFYLAFLAIWKFT